MFRKLSKIQAIQQQELGGRYDSVKDPLRDSVVLHLATQEGWNGSPNNLFIDESPNIPSFQIPLCQVPFKN